MNKLQYSYLNKRNFEELGLSFSSIESIILGDQEIPLPVLHSSTPKNAASFIYREYAACSHAFENISSNGMTVLSPFDDELVLCSASFILNLDIKRYSEILVKKFTSINIFYLIFSGITSRVTHIFIPHLDLIIFDYDDSISINIAENIKINEKKIAHHKNNFELVGIIDMVTNYAHQAVNHLSGLQRLIDSEKLNFYSKILICGVHFFGDEKLVFPELTEKIFLVSKDYLKNNFYNGSEVELIKIGSCFLNQKLKNRLINFSSASYPFHLPYSSCKVRSPIIAFTTRTVGRRCINLVDVVIDLVCSLLTDFPNLGIVIDGWVFPESEISLKSSVITSINSMHISTLKDESEIVYQIINRLPGNVYIGSTLGDSALLSINKLIHIDAYFAHIGTLQHKLGWFSGAKGIVHGPTTELSRTDSNWFSCENVYAGQQIDISSIEDIESPNARGSGFIDYKITNTISASHLLKQILLNN